MTSEKTRASFNENSADDATRYRPNIQARNIIIQRALSNFGAPALIQQVSKREPYSRYSSSGMDPSAYAAMSNTEVKAVKDSSERGKKDLGDLNVRLHEYIGKVRFFETENRKLRDELEKLKGKWGTETSKIKAMYETELDEARRLLDEAVKEKSRLKVRLASVEDMMEELQQKLDDALKDAAESKGKFEQQNQQLSDLEGEVILLKRRFPSLEKERDKEKALNKKLQDALNTTRLNLDNETLRHIDAENRAQTLEEMLNFLKDLHEQELKELQALTCKDSAAETHDYWKTEMGQALRDIQEAYDDKMDTMRGEMETHYTLKVQQLQNGAAQNNMQSVHLKEESVRLRDQMKILRDKLADSENKYAQVMRELELLKREKVERERELEHSNSELLARVAQLEAEMDAVIKEIQTIASAKHLLDAEISIYRTLLDKEDTRYTQRCSEPSSGETSVSLRNQGRKLTEEQLGNWSLTRSVDGKDSFSYKFPEAFVLQAGEKIKVWSKGTKPSTAATGDLESDQNWGIGAHIITKLVNPAGEERAAYIQQTKFSEG